MRFVVLVALASSSATALQLTLAHAPQHGLTRRAALSALPPAAAAAAALLALRPVAPALAKQDASDLSRLRKGLKDIEFLLDNWERETTNPNSGEADPDRVRLFVGLRTTDSPLFQVDKLLTSAQDKVGDDDFEKWIEVSEGFQSHLNKINELAYTSSFGEYNPGGGKDQIAKYLELARGEVVLMRDSLKDILTILGV